MSASVQQQQELLEHTIQKVYKLKDVLLAKLWEHILKRGCQPFDSSREWMTKYATSYVPDNAFHTLKERSSVCDGYGSRDSKTVEFLRHDHFTRQESTSPSPYSDFVRPLLDEFRALTAIFLYHPPTNVASNSTVANDFCRGLIFLSHGCRVVWVVNDDSTLFGKTTLAELGHSLFQFLAPNSRTMFDTKSLQIICTQTQCCKQPIEWNSNGKSLTIRFISPACACPLNSPPTVNPLNSPPTVNPLNSPSTGNPLISPPTVNPLNHLLN